MAGILCNMGNNVQFGERRNELLGIVALVSPQRDFSGFIGHLTGVSNHGFGRFPLCMAICGGNHRTGNQAMAVVAQCVPHVTQLTGRVAFAV